MLHRPARGTATGLPISVLNEIHDCLSLALGATERRAGYTQAEREARSYVRTALRRVEKLTEVAA